VSQDSKIDPPVSSGWTNSSCAFHLLDVCSSQFGMITIVDW